MLWKAISSGTCMQAPYLWRFCPFYLTHLRFYRCTVDDQRERLSTRGRRHRMEIMNCWRSRGFSLLIAAGLVSSAAALDSAFQKWLQGLWPEAQALGVSRRTFEEATRAVEPDLTLPDLELPGRETAPPRGQAEFVQTPADY